MRVDVIVTAGTPASLAVKKATTSIPLVMIAVGDPVGYRSRREPWSAWWKPHGMISIAPELAGKRLELLTEVIPKLSTRRLTLNAAEPDTT